MVAMAAADGEIDERELGSMAAIYRNVTGASIRQTAIKSAAAARKGGATNLFERLALLAPKLDRDAKDQILRAAYLVLLADDDIAGAERKTLQDIAAALKVPEVHFGAIMEEVAIWLQQQGQQPKQ